MQLACMRVCVHLCVCVSTHTWSLTNNWKTHNLQNQPQPVLLPTPNWITACISMKQQRREHWKRTFFRRWNQPLHSNLTWANLQPSFQLKFNEQLLCIRNGGCSDLIGSLPLSLINISPVFWTFFFNIERLESVRMEEGIDDIKEYWWQDRNRTSLDKGCKWHQALPPESLIPWRTKPRIFNTGLSSDWFFQCNYDADGRGCNGEKQGRGFTVTG